MQHVHEIMYKKGLKKDKDTNVRKKEIQRDLEELQWEGRR